MSKRDTIQDACDAQSIAPQHEHVQVRLYRIWSELHGAHDCPWEPVTLEHHRESTVPYLCGHLDDGLEAADWACRIEAEMLRLDGLPQPASTATRIKRMP